MREKRIQLLTKNCEPLGKADDLFKGLILEFRKMNYLLDFHLFGKSIAEKP